MSGNLTLTPGTYSQIQPRIASLNTIVKWATSATHNVAHDLRTERVATKDKLRVRTTSAICRDLLSTAGHAVGRLITVSLVAVKDNVLSVAAGKARTDSVGKCSHSTWIRLAVSTRQEEVHI